MNTSLTKFCKDHDLSKSSVHRRCQELGFDTSDGLTPEAYDRLLHEFSVTANPVVPVNHTVDVEIGNHSSALALPELPQTYSLEVLRTSEAIGFEDPLAIAAQFLQAADGLTTAMQSDIQQREQRLQQTKQAKDVITAKAQHLQLESRLYQLQTSQLDSTLTTETQALQTALTRLQGMGKPQAVEGGSPA